MAFKLHPEIASALSAALQVVPATPPDDVIALRTFVDVGTKAAFAQLPDSPSVATSKYVATGINDRNVPLCWCTKRGSDSRAAVIFAHGGGMVGGSLGLFGSEISHYVEMTGVPFLGVGYGLAPEHREAGLARDVFTAVQWLIHHAPEFGVDARRIALMGESGGGGVAAGAAILARDRGIPISRQILIYPMLDDRNVVPDRSLQPFASWTYEINRTAWKAVLGDSAGADGISPYIAPARLENFADLAPAFIEVGELDIFRDESVSYATRLLAAGVSCELHVHAGVPHGAEWADPSSKLSQRILADRARIINSL